MSRHEIPPHHAPVEPGQGCPRCRALAAVREAGPPWTAAQKVELLLEALLEEHSWNWGDDGCPEQGRQDSTRCPVHELARKVRG